MDKILFNALVTYFRAEGIKLKHSELELQLFSHPDTPSLFAVAETLNFLRIKNVAAKIDTEQLDGLPEHFIAFVENDKRGQYFSHVQQNEKQVYLHAHKEAVSKQRFKQLWNGVVLLAEQETSPNVSEDRRTKIVGTVVPFLLLGLLLWQHIPELLFCAIGLFGLYLSHEIFETSQDRGSTLGDKICGQQEESGCNKVLKSPHYRLGMFTPNDLLFSFLLSTLLPTVVSTGYGSAHGPLYFMGFLAVFSSIAIQAFVLRSWCRLCLFSGALILIQGLLVFLVPYHPGTPFLELPAHMYLKDFGVFGMLFLASLLGIHNYRGLKAENYRSGASEMELLRFKRSSKTIERILAGERKIEQLEGADQLVFGNQNAATTIRLVLSTKCSFCKKAFVSFYRFYQLKATNFRFVLVLNHYDTQPSKRNDIASTLIHSYTNGGPEEFLETMHHWFLHQDEDKFLIGNTIDFTDTDYDILSLQRQWCKDNELFHTPILIVNATVVPEYYDMSFLEDILEALEAAQ